MTMATEAAGCLGGDLASATCQHLRGPLQERCAGSSALISLWCPDCGLQVAPCLACCAPIAAAHNTPQASAPDKNGGDVVYCGSCGAVNPRGHAQVERTLLGLPNVEAMSSSLARKVQEAVCGRRQYYLANRREQALLRQVLVDAMQAEAPHPSPEASRRRQGGHGTEPPAPIIASETTSSPSSEQFLGRNPTASLPHSPAIDALVEGTHPLETSTPSGGTQHGGLRRISNHPKRKLSDNTESGRVPCKQPRLSSEVPWSPPAPQAARRDASAQVTNLTDVTLDEINEAGWTSHNVASQNRELQGYPACQRNAVPFELLRCSTTFLALQSWETMVEDCRRPAMELPIFCAACPNNASRRIQETLRQQPLNPEEIVSQKPCEAVGKSRLLVRVSPVGPVHLALLRTSYSWLHSCNAPEPTGISALLARADKFVREADRLLERRTVAASVCDAAEQAAADFQALACKRRTRGCGKQGPYLLEAVLTGLMQERVHVCAASVSPSQAQHASLLHDINEELKRILARAREIQASEIREGSGDAGVQISGLACLEQANVEELEVLRSCYPLWLLLYHAVFHATNGVSWPKN